MDASDPTTISADDREQIFITDWGNNDPSLALGEVFRAAGDYLSILVGPEAADAGMAEMVMPAILASDGTPEEARADWRAALTEHGHGETLTEWAFGSALYELVAYGRYGIARNAPKGTSCEQWLHDLIERGVQFCGQTPDSWFSGDTQIKHEVMLASNRWAMDNNRPLDPLAVAEFGGVSEGRIRNMMSGDGRTFHPDADRLIPAHEALGWLSGRKSFWNSIWRETPSYLTSPRRGYSQPFFVPVARDRSIFHPGLRRRGTYTVGAKYEEEHFENFHEALEVLQKLPIAYWRRPNETANWGLVAGVSWERLDWEDLIAFADDPARRLP